MDIYVMNRNFVILDIIDYSESVIWTKRYTEAGDFEIVVPACKHAIDLLIEDNFIARTDDDAIMIIKKVQLQTNLESGDKLIVSGPSIESCLAQRIVWAQTNLNGNVASGITTLLNDNAINPTDAARKLDRLTRGGMCMKSTQLPLIKQITGDQLDEAISAICKTYGLGYKITLDDGKLVFELYSGYDRSYSQKTNPYVVFSEEFGNLLSSDYTYDKTNYKNVAMVAGEGEGTARKKSIVGNANGWDRYEIFVDQRNLSTNNGEISDAEYASQLDESGNEKLAECQITESFESSVDPTTNYVYGKDYFLGDIVQIENAYGIQAKARITEVIESEDESGHTYMPTFEVMEV